MVIFRDLANTTQRLRSLITHKPCRADGLVTCQSSNDVRSAGQPSYAFSESDQSITRMRAAGYTSAGPLPSVPSGRVCPVRRHAALTTRLVVVAARRRLVHGGP